MTRIGMLLLLMAGLVAAAEPVRERMYHGAVTVGGQSVPLYDKGYLVYLHQPNRLDVFRPDGQRAFNLDLPCPGTGTCGASAVAVDAQGNLAVGFGYWGHKGKSGGIRLLSPQGQETRFIETDLFLPTALCFGSDGALWALGWQRDSLTREDEQKEVDYFLLRKFSADGRQIGQYLPRSLWPGRKSRPAYSSRGYWRIYAAKDRIGAIIHESHADNQPEWIEWDHNGVLLSRTVLPDRHTRQRAYTVDGRLYNLTQASKDKPPELRVLDVKTRLWTVIPTNLPEKAEQEGAVLLGADGKDLVYRMGSGNVRLLLVQPGEPE